MKTTYPSLRSFGMMLAFLAVTLIAVSCKKEKLDVQQNFPFEVQSLPVPPDLAYGQKVEIRVTIQSSGGNFNDATYQIRYFQKDGDGTLQYQDKSPYRPNDEYVLPAKQFSLYYISRSRVKQTFDVWITDDFGNERKISFKFESNGGTVGLPGHDSDGSNDM